MRLILQRVKPCDVVKNETYLLMKKTEPRHKGGLSSEEWYEAVASDRGWVFDDAPDEIDPERKWPTMIFQCPRDGVLAGTLDELEG